MELRILTIESEKQRRRNERTQRGEPLQRIRFVEPLTRLITSDDGITTIVNKTILDINEGREDVPLLYTPLYRTLASDNLPRTIDLNLFATAAAIFLERFEGGEVHFGHMAPNTPASVSLKNFSSGFEWTRELEMFDETWRMEEFNRSLGEAYNALLNYLHFGPILAYAYTGANQTPADTTGATLMDKTRITLQNALRTSTTEKRPGSILIASSANRYQIEDAIARRYDNVGNMLPELGQISTIIYYDGWSVTVGPKTYTYPGVTAGKAYLIQPQRRLRELVRTENGQDLIVERGDGDVSRRIVEQMTAHTYRTVYADVAGSTEEITLP